MSVLGRPGGRNILVFTDLIELWTWLLVVFLSSVAVIALPALLMDWPLAAVLAVPCFILLHVLLLWRVLLRRRWACMLSSFYGWLFFFPYPGVPHAWSMAGAWLLSVIAASVIVGWRELTDGW
jgi:hypothetical protein